MSSEIAIEVASVSKSYRIFQSPGRRFIQQFLRSRAKLYKEVAVLKDVSLSVRQGETVGIVGANGAGKSTLLAIIASVLQPTSGTVRVDGRVTALLSLGAGFVPDMTGRENVYVNGAVLGMSREEISSKFADIADFADIGDYIDQPVKTYSSGMFSRLAFAVAIHTSPDVLIIDETLSVGDEAFQRKCFARIDLLKSTGVTVLFVSHSAGAVLELCDRAILLVGGECLLTGSPKLVVSQYQKLIYAADGRRAEVLREIRELGECDSDSEDSREPMTIDRPSSSQLDDSIGERFDETMQSQSCLSYVEQGARIYDVCIVNGHDKMVNVLQSNGEYYYRFRVEFSKPAINVRFSFMLKSVTGLELGVMWSDLRGRGVSIEAGDRIEVRFPFKLPFREGAYFGNAGVTGVVDGEYVTMHRIIDATMFKVQPQVEGFGDLYVNLVADDKPVEVNRLEATQQ